MKIAFVFDGVLADSRRVKASLAWTFFGATYFRINIIERSALSPDQYVALQERVYETREAGLRLELADSALYYLYRLKTDGHEVFAVTLRSQVGQKIAQEWCDQRGIKLDFVIVENRRIEAEKFPDFDFFVAKKESQLSPLVGIVKNLLLFSSSIVPSNFKMVSSWEMLYRAIPYAKKR